METSSQQQAVLPCSRHGPSPSIMVLPGHAAARSLLVC